MNILETDVMWKKVTAAFIRQWRWLILAIFLSLVVWAPLESTQAQEGDSAEILDVVAAVPPDFPPQYSVDENGRSTGFAIDVMDEIAALAGLRVTYQVEESWADVNAALLDGRADLIPNLGISPQRQADFDFTSPVETFPISIFVRQPTTDIQSEADLVGHTVAVVEFNVAVGLLQDNPGVELIEFNDAPSALFALLAGEADALVYPQSVTLQTARSIGVEERIKVVGEPISEVKRGIAVRQDNPELLARLETAVNTFTNSAEYQQIYVKWHGEPQPYWTAVRVGWAMGGLLLLVLVVMGVWRYAAIHKLNRQLVENDAERAQAAEALRSSEEHFRTAFENSAIGMCLTGLNGELLRVNHAMSQMFAFSADEFLGKHFNDVTHPDDFNIGKGAIRQLLAGTVSSISFEKRYVKKSGETFLANVTTALLHDASGQPLHFVTQIVDITERVQSEQELNASEARFRALLEQSPFSTHIYQSNGKLLTINQASADLWHISPEGLEHLMENYNIFQDEQLRDNGLMPYIERSFAGEVVRIPALQYNPENTETTRKLEMQTMWVQGFIYPIKDQDGKVREIVLMHEDITERVQAEDELEKHRESLEEIVAERTRELSQRNDELRRFALMAADREIRMKELREENKILRDRS